MKNTKTLLVTLIVFLISFEGARAARLLTKDEALTEMFPNADKVVEETIELTKDNVAQLQSILGGQLVHYKKDNASSSERMHYTFYFAMKNNEKTGVAIIDEQPGKWGPVEMIVALDVKTVKVSNLAVMSYKEKRGRPIARKNFLKQFIGKMIGDGFKLRKDIRAISGATVSSDCACFAVKKVLALYQVVYQ